MKLPPDHEVKVTVHIPPWTFNDCHYKTDQLVFNARQTSIIHLTKLVFFSQILRVYIMPERSVKTPKGRNWTKEEDWELISVYGDVQKNDKCGKQPTTENRLGLFQANPI